jgi:hypothetical protein
MLRNTLYYPYMLRQIVRGSLCVFLFFKLVVGKISVKKSHVTQTERSKRHGLSVLEKEVQQVNI